MFYMASPNPLAYLRCYALSGWIARINDLNPQKSTGFETRKICLINDRFWDISQCCKTNQVKPNFQCQNPSQKQNPKTYALKRF